MQKSQLPELFSQILPKDSILTDSHDLAYYGKDVCHEYKAAPALILRPQTTEQVSQILRKCNAQKLAVVPSGGRTGYSGGATAQKGEIVLSLERMSKIIEIDPIERTVTSEAGVTTEALRQAVAKHDLFYPLDFASKGSSQIGGNLSTNAGGIRVIRYGMTRDWVLGLKAVMASGEVLELNNHLFKNASGYDLRNLLIGAEGTLGVIVEATLKLTSPPTDSALALCALDTDEVVLECLKETRAANFTVNVFEYFERKGLEAVLAHNQLPKPFAEISPYYLLIEVETKEPAERARFEHFVMSLLERGVAKDAVLAQNSKHYADLLALRELIGESVNKHYFPYKNDISVPVPSITNFMRELRKLVTTHYPSFDVLIFGHVGDGNLHVNMIKPQALEPAAFIKQCEAVDPKIFELVQKYKGSISAEHGVGLLKKPFLKFTRSQTEIELMRGIKKVFDPNGILNPGKIFD